MFADNSSSYPDSVIRNMLAQQKSERAGSGLDIRYREPSLRACRSCKVKVLEQFLDSSGYCPDCSHEE